jgi:hypothetical protein
VGPRAVLDAVVKRKIPSPRRESNPRTSIVQPVTQRYYPNISLETTFNIRVLEVQLGKTNTEPVEKISPKSINEFLGKMFFHACDVHLLLLILFTSFHPLFYLF